MISQTSITRKAKKASHTMDITKAMGYQWRMFALCTSGIVHFNNDFTGNLNQSAHSSKTCLTSRQRPRGPCGTMGDG